MAAVVARGRLRVVARTLRDAACEVGVWWADRYGWPEPLTGLPPVEERTVCRLAGRDATWDYWEAELSMPTGRYKYLFWVVPARPEPQAAPGSGPGPSAGFRIPAVWFGDGEQAIHPRDLWPYELPDERAAEIPVVPDWARGAVFYQIFVDRFYNGDPSNDPPETLPWPTGEEGARSEVPQGSRIFYGGDLAGITQKIPYLASLGIDAIYLTPIFRSPTNHKYDTEDYLSVDPAFGSLEALRQLTSEAHRHGIRVILDLVFHHSGDRFFAFEDVVAKGEASAYREWYFVRDFPVKRCPPNYDTFATGVAGMPKLNTAHPAVRRYLVDVAVHWVKAADVDGFRLDVANDVSRLLWRDLVQAARAVRPDLFFIGEAWHRAASWLRGDQWDSVMNYPWRRAVLDFFASGTIPPTVFWERLESLRFTYAPPVSHALVNLIGSHDTPRFLRLAGGEMWRLRLATLFQFAYPGIAQVYYGDEVGMDGGSDPDCRRPMNWTPDRDGLAMLALTRKLGQWRHRYPALRWGDLRLEVADDRADTLAFWRPSPASGGSGAAPSGACCLVLVNRGGAPWELPLPQVAPPGAVLEDHVATGQLEVTAHSITVGPRSGAILALAAPGQ